MSRKAFLYLALLISVFLSAGPVLPCEKTLFGPKNFQVGRFFFHSSFQSFKVNSHGNAVLEISNANSHAKIRSGYMNLNGRFLSLGPMLHGKDSTKEVPVSLRYRNYLWVFLYGQRGAAIKFKVKEANQEQTNHAPVAVATSPDQAFVGQTVVLDGSKSSDIDGDKLTYRWTLTSCPTALEQLLSSGLEPALSTGLDGSAFFVPIMPGDYKVQLIVNDGKTDSSPTIVTISVAYSPFTLTEDKLIAGDGSGDSLFGSSVSVDTHRAIVGAEGKEAAYIFESNSPWAEKIQLSSGRAGDRFGSAVAVSGDYALVGAYADADLGVDSGAAYMFEWNGTQWIKAAKLTADDGNAGDFFGASVALSGDLAVVGAHGDDTNDEKWVQVFGEDKYLAWVNGMIWNSALQQWENNGTETFILQPNPSEVWAYNFRPLAIRVTHTSSEAINSLQVIGTTGLLGSSTSKYVSRQPVPLSGKSDISYIYAYYCPSITNIEFLVPPTGGAADAGSVYFFKREGDIWTQQAKLTASDGAEGDAFGISVAVSGQTILVGADGEDDNGQDSGSAYVFYQNGTSWAEEAKLLATDGKDGDRFGASVAVSGNIAVVGAPHPDLADAEPGAAYVFRYNGEKWIQEAKLTVLDGKAGDLFGTSVSISNDYLVVGAPGADGWGAFYVFKFDDSEWTLEGKVVPTDKAEGQGFGGSVSISGDEILSGSAGDGEKGNQAGAAYVYSIDTYHAAGISAAPEIITAGITSANESFTLSWSWVNALVVQIGPDIGTFDVTDTPTGTGSSVVSPGVTTTYTLTAYGPYGKDTASVTLLVEP